jgi:hypothetical protein
LVKEKSAIQTEGESRKEETEKLDAKTQKVKQPKEEKPAFPHETTINAYGFLQFGADIMQEALGLTKSEKNPSGRAVFPETKVSIESYDAKTRTFMIKVT